MFFFMDLYQIPVQSCTKFICKTRLSLVVYNCALDFWVVTLMFLLVETKVSEKLAASAFRFDRTRVKW